MKWIKKLSRKLNKSGKWESYAIFWCDGCKQEVERQLSNGKIAKSCGCKKDELIGKSNRKHGNTGMKLYVVWINMKQRILNSNNENYKDYGGRGITVCPEWANDYAIFRDWALSNGYKEGLQIHRENDGNYEPNNCRWVTSEENNRNRRGQKIKDMKMADEIRKLEKTGVYTKKELAIKFKIKQTTISKIIRNKIWK